MPRLNVMPEPEVGAFLQAHPVGQLVTVGADGAPDATLLPILIDSAGGKDRVVAHFARANDHWRRIVNGSPALLVVTGADAYVSPSWYASKAEHGRVVPTWNYSAVHLSGPVTTHDDLDWVRTAVTRLTERHESERAAPWAVTDAPDKYVTGQLRGVVGVEMTVEKIEAKAKLSQNRSDDDRFGVIVGLREESGRPGARGPWRWRWRSRRHSTADVSCAVGQTDPVIDKSSRHHRRRTGAGSTLEAGTAALDPQAFVPFFAARQHPGRSLLVRGR